MSEDGILAEALSATYLRAQGLKLLEKNYRCRFGEIDLILRDGVTLVFAEVRLRKNQNFGGAAASITRSKQQRILAAARHYLSGMKTPACRFDVLLLHDLNPEHIEWIQNAFGE